MSLASLTARARDVPRWTLAVVVAAAASFLALALLVALGATRATDLGVIVAFQSVASHPLDLAVNAHTVLGQLAVTLPAAAILAIVVRRRLGGHAWIGPLFILATGGIELVFKYAVGHPGPPEEFDRAFWNPLGIPRSLQPPNAFPSGHVARLTFLVIVLVGLFPSRVWWVLAGVFVAFTVFARVYIGDHWISDALAGLALGTGVGAGALAWVRATAARRSVRPATSGTPR